MTQEDKQLLLKDLCARLPYGVKIHINSPIEEQNRMVLFDVNLEGETIGVATEKYTFRAIRIVDDDDSTRIIKPYLRPMSSMTSEELKEFAQFTCLSMHRFICSVTNTDHWYNTYEEEDWLNAHHFDFRGLIEKGLAIEAPEEMYKTK